MTFSNKSGSNFEKPPKADSIKPNILFVIADDMGLDATPGYDIGNIKPKMPNLQELTNTGLKFNNLWANPTCSPTRASIITGKYGFRTNVLRVRDVLSTDEESLQTHISNLTNNSYANAVIGKWHLSNDVNHPNNMGVTYHAGYKSGNIGSYFDFTLNINGSTSNSTTYATTKFTDLAIDWISKQNKPWFLWLAYNAPHTPFHLPPNNLHSQGDLPSDKQSIRSNPLPYYLAAIEAIDTEMGRLLNSLSKEERDNTIIIFIGDNGTPIRVAQAYEFRRAKGSVYQGGVNVPMIVSGKGVSRINETENALINTTDLFATIADIAGAGTTQIHDSKTFKPLLTNKKANTRNYVYAESKDLAIRNNTHKYIKFNNDLEALYNLNEDPLETKNLLELSNLPLHNTDERMKNKLTQKLQELRN